MCAVCLASCPLLFCSWICQCCSTDNMCKAQIWISLVLPVYSLPLQAHQRACRTCSPILLEVQTNLHKPLLVVGLDCNGFFTGRSSSAFLKVGFHPVVSRACEGLPEWLGSGRLMPCSPHQQASCFSAYFVSPLLEAGCCLPVVPSGDLVWQVGYSLQGVAALPRKAKLLAKYEDHTMLSSVAVAPNSKTFLYPSTDSLLTLFMKS